MVKMTSLMYWDQDLGEARHNFFTSEVHHDMNDIKTIPSLLVYFRVNFLKNNLN